MRLLVALFLVNGLVPGLGEVVESAVHYAAEGHLSHSDADHGDLGDQGSEHGCGTTTHVCACCASMSVMAPSVRVALLIVPVRPSQSVVGVSVVSLDAPAPPIRPPIAS